MKKLGLFLLFMTALFCLSCTIGLGKAVDTEAPEIAISSPAVDSVIRDAFAFKGTWSDDGEITGISLTLSNTSSESETPIKFDGTFETSADGTGTWKVEIDPLSTEKPVADGTYEATVLVTDGGEHTTKLARSIVIDNTAPIVVLQRPSSKAGESPDAYGQTFTLEGQSADDNDVSLIEVNIYGDADCTNFLHQVKLTNVPPTISLDVAKFVEDEENDYYKIYGSKTKDGTKNFYVSIKAYDSAQRYPMEGNQEASDTNGNSTDFYYLYEDISTAVLSDHKITDVYHMISGTYTGSDGERAADTITEVNEILSENKITVGAFSLNPANNPYFTVSGRDALLKDGTDFSNTNNYITNGSSVVIEVATGLDSIPLDEESLKVYAVPCDLNGVPTSTETDARIYPETTKSKSGTSYKFVTVISTATGFSVGSDYVFGVEGTDQKNNEVVNSGNGYGFHMSSSGAAPVLTVTSPADTISYLKKGDSQIFAGNVSVEEGIPTLVILKGEDVIWTKTFTTSEAKATAAGRTFNFSYEIPAGEGGFSQTESSQNSYTIKTTQEGQTTLSNKTIMYDVDGPSIDIQSIAPYAYKYKNEAGEEETDSDGEKVQYLNGKITAKFSIVDDFDTVDESNNPPKYEFFLCEKDKISDTARKGDIPTYTVNSLKQEIKNIDTASWKDASGNQYKGPVTLRVTAYDRSGNETTAYESFQVDQDTDKPVVLPNSSSSVTFTYTDFTVADGQTKTNAQLAIEDSGKNSFALGSQLLVKLIDDDGIKSVQVKRESLKNGTVKEETPVEYANYPTEVVYTYVLPSSTDDPGYYKFTIVAEDIYGTKTTIGPFGVRITAAAPGLSTVTATVSPVTTSAATIAVNQNAKTQFKNKVEVSSTEAPFYIFRKEAQYDDADFPLVKPENLTAGSPIEDGSSVIFAGSTEDTEFTDSVTPTGTDNKTYYYKVFDRNWNGSNVKSVVCKIDSENPAAPVIASPSAETTYLDGKNYVISVTGITDAASSISKIYYVFQKAGNDGTFATPAASSYTAQDYSSDKWNLTVNLKSGDGTSDSSNLYEGYYKLFIKTEDAAGNWSSITGKDFYVDLSDPTVEVKDTAATPAALSEKSTIYFKEDYKFTVTASDTNPLGISSVVVMAGETVVTPNAETGVYSLSGITADQNITLTVTVTDQSGRYTKKTYTVYKDATAPVLAITSPVNANNYRNVDSYTFKGTLKESHIDTATVSLYKDDSTTALKTEDIQLPTPVDNVYTWSWTATDLEEGKYKVVVNAEDEAGNKAAATSGYVYYDKTLPVITTKGSGLYTTEGSTVTADTQIAETTNYYAKSTFTISPVIDEAHYSSSNVKITATRNGASITSPALTESVAGSKNWSFTTTPDSDGTYVYTISATDLAENKATASYIVIYDATAPSVTITEPTEGYITAASSAVTLKGSVSDSGIGLKSLEYSVDNGTNWTDLSVPSTSEWSTTYTPTAEGTVSFKVKAADKLGTERITDVRTFYYDQATPVLTVVTPISGVSTVNESYYLKAGGKLTLSGTAYDTNELKSISISDVVGSGNATVYTDAAIKRGDSTVEINTAKDDSTKITWSKELSASALRDGTHTFTITAEDIAGRKTQQTYTVIVDVTAPSVTSIKCPSVYETPNSSFTFTGNAKDEGGSSLSAIYFGFADKSADTDLSDSTKFTKLDGSTVWAYTLNKTTEFTSVWKTEGTKTVYVYAEDTAGNISAAAKTAELTYDTSDPELKTLTLNDGGTAFDLSTTEPKLSYGGLFSLAGTVFDNWEVESVTVTENTNTAVSSDNISITGTGKTKTLKISNLPTERDSTDNTKPKTGDYTYTISIKDKAEKTTTKNVKVSVDVSAPVPTITAPTSAAKNDKSLSADDYTFRGGVSDEGSSGMKALYYAITSTEGIPSAAVTDTSVWTKLSQTTTDDWSFNKYLGAGTTVSDADTIYEGQHYLYVKAEDNAGNVTSDAKTPSVAFYVDKAAPVISDATDNNAKAITENSTFYYDDTTDDGKAGKFTLKGKILESNGLNTFTSKVDGNTAADITKPTASTSAVDWSQTLTGITADTSHKVVITAQDKAERTAVSSTYYLYRDTAAPVITITNPDANVEGTSALSWTGTNGSYTLRANVSDAGSGINGNTYKYWVTQTVLENDTAIKNSAKAPSDNKWSDYTGGQSFTDPLTLVSGTSDTTNIHEGKWYVYFYAVDAVGHESVASRYFWVDKANPEVSVIFGNSTVTKSEDYTDTVTLTTNDKTAKTYISATDTHGLDTTYGITDSTDSTKKTGFAVTLSKSNGTVVTPATIAKDSTGYYFTLPETPADDTYTYTVTAKDRAGKTTSVTRKLRLDTTGPALDTTSPTFTDGVSSWLTSRSITVLGTASDESGVSKIYYALDKTVTLPTAASETWTNWESIAGSSNWTISLSSDTDGAEHKLYLSAVDGCGNMSSIITKTLKVDATAPTLEEKTVGLTGKKITASDSGNVTLSGNFTDSTSGINSIVIEDNKNSFTAITIASTSVTSGTWSQDIAISSDGEHTITITGTDLAGNKSTVQRSIVVDTQPPYVTGITVADTNKSKYTGASGDQVWYKSNSNGVTVTGISDTQKNNYASEIASVEYSTNASADTPIWISMTQDSTTTTTYTANVNCSAQGANTITIRIKDAVGNVNQGTSATIYIDTEKPEIPESYTVTYNGTEYKTNGGLFTDQLIINGRNNVTLALNPTDSGSGIAKVSKGTSKSESATSGVYTLEITPANLTTGNINITLTDNVGLTTTWNPFTILKDTSVPTVTISDPDDADESTAGIQVNGKITLEGRAKDSGGSDLKQVDVCYATSDAADSWKHLSTITSTDDLNNWSVTNVNTATAFGTLTDPTTVYICAIVTDNAGNRNTDTTSGTTVTDNTTTYTTTVGDVSYTYLIPSKKPSEIAAANIKTIIVNQDTDRPKISFTNIDLSGMSKTSSTTNYAYLNNTNTLYGIATDDDGISAVYYNKRVDLTAAPSDWSTASYYSDAACTTKAGTFAAGTYYIKEQVTVSGSGSFSISGLSEGANEIHFWVTDTENGTFPSTTASGPKLTGNESNAAVKDALYLRINTTGPVISDLTFQRYDTATSDYEKDSSGNYITKTLAQLNSSYKFGGTKYTKVKVIAKATDENGIKSVKIGDIAGTQVTGKTDYYEMEVSLASITESGPTSFIITAEDNIPDVNSKSVSMKTTQNFDITIDKTAPAIQLTSHKNGASIKSSFTLKGTVDDANATMKYLVTSSAAAPTADDWASDAAADYTVSTGDTITTWSITFDNDTLNSDEEHSYDQKEWFIKLYSSADASGTTYGIVKNDSGTIVIKTSGNDDGNDTSTPVHEKYRTNKPFYFHFLLTDEFGNTASLPASTTPFYLTVDPQGDIPVITMTSPTASSYLWYSSSGTYKESKASHDASTAYGATKTFTDKDVDGTDPSGTYSYRGPFTTASGRILVSGSAEDDKTIKALYMQIDPTYDVSGKFTWVGGTDTVPAAGTSGKTLADYYNSTSGTQIEDFYAQFTSTEKYTKFSDSSKTYGKNGIYIGDSTAWTIKLNTSNEFNGSGTNNNTIAIRLFAVDEDGNVYEPGDSDVLIITIDSGAPKLGQQEEFAVWQYAWTDATAGTIYTNTPTPTTASKAYKDSGCTTEAETSTISAVTTETVNNAAVYKSITVGGTTYTKAFVSKTYTEDMWLKGIWWLEGSIEDEQGIATATIKVDSSVTETSLVSKDKSDSNNTPSASSTYTTSGSWGTGDAATSGYIIRYPIGNAVESKYGSLSYTLTVEDNSDAYKENSKTFSINYDNKVPELASATGSDSDFGYNATTGKYEIVNTDGFFTMGSKVTEQSGESGYDRTVVYFKRTSTGYKNIYDVFQTKTSSPIGYESGLTEMDGMYWNAVNVTGISGSTITVAAPAYAHAGGIVKFGGSIYTIQSIASGNASIVIDGTPNSALSGTKMYFGIGAVVERSSTGTGAKTEGKTADTKNTAGYYTSISGDDKDCMIESVTIQGTEAKWAANINTKNIPDGPIEIHYVVYDQAGNSSHGQITSNAFVKNNAPMIASVTVATTFTGGDTPEYEETYYVSEKTRKINGAEVKKSIGVKNNVVVSGNEQGTTAFMTIKDKTWIKPEIVGGNGELFYKYKVNNGSEVNGGSLGNATVEGGENYLNTIDDNENNYVEGQVLSIPITTSILDTITTNSTIDSPTTFFYTISDSTEGTTGGLTATIDVKLAVNYNDSSAPKSVILPFEWTGTGTTEYSERVNNAYAVRCYVPNNNIYEGNVENGHIELEDDLDSTTASSLYGADPKVSGKISIRGYSYDDIRLSNIWIKMDSFTFTDGTAGSGTTANYIKAASYDKTSGTWTGYGDITKGWKFNVYASSSKGNYETLPVTTDSTYEKVHNNNLGAYYGSYFNQDGQKVFWQLDIDTSKLSTVAGTDKKLYVITEAEKGDSSYKYSSTTADTTTGDANLNTPSYQMDVVPYITMIYTKLGKMKSGNWSVYGRTAAGHYTVASDETAYIYGFNLGNSSYKPNYGGNTLSAPTAGGTLVDTYPSGTATTSISGADYTPYNVVAFPVSKVSTSGSIELTVNGIKTLNNYNKNFATGTSGKTITSTSSTANKQTYAYNLQPNGDNNNLLTDDVVLDVWQINDSAAKPTSGAVSDVVMKINPSTNEVGFAFANGQLNFAMPNTNTSYTNWQRSYESYHCVGLAYDSNGTSFAVAAGGDSNSHQADLFNFMSSKFGVSDTSNKSGSYLGINSLRLESIGQLYDSDNDGVQDGAYGDAFTVEPERFQSPSIVTSLDSSKNTNVYLAYWDKINDEIRFRYGNLNNTSNSMDTSGTIRDYYKSNELYIGTVGKTTYTSGAANCNNGYYWTGGCQILATTSGSGVLGKAGNYVSIGVVNNSSTSNKDVVVMVWYDQHNNKLCYSYNTTPTTVRTGANSTGWSSSIDILSSGEGGQYCQLAVDAAGGIHIAAYTGLNNEGNLKYAYLSSYQDTKADVYTVDSNGIIGDNLTLDVAKVGDNYVPYIGYYSMSQAMPKYAYKLSDGNGVNKGNEDFTGNWEVSFVPTSSAVPQSRINVGVFKTSAGVRAYSTKDKKSTGTKGTSTANAGSGNCWGNGTDYPILGYERTVSSSEAYVETAQMK